ncbi:uncharacterized protein LOC129576935 [Sitodiplosis mosellana]|uniref:uncharacterized protein LOC129576935 n=1 Tax=Sitodiplosis mosellana TaxID=263140 RepID=UPI002444D9D7|nr:uncharacterized protein LOC129576935 [Sitodiplosis mosellana]XP_055319070.1 uncharacterized protein LOC129576935 [Sitodiplosis mosellana]
MLENPSSPTSCDVRAFAEQTLIDRIFMGDYQEKRYVAKLNAYKDLIVLNRQEQILAGDLSKVKNQILGDNVNAWCGFTDSNEIGAPAAHCLWTTLDEPNKVKADAASVVFGEYWFQIKGLRFALNAVEIQVTVLRPIDPTSPMPSGLAISSLAQQALEVDTQKIQQYVQENIIEVDWANLFNQWKASINQMAYRFFTTEITWTNFVHCIKLLGVFCIAFAKLSVHFVHCIGEFTLRLVFELTKLTKAASPIVLAVINLLSKMIGGFYILVAMIWKDLFYGDSGNRKNPPSGLNNYGFNNGRALTYHENPRPFLQSSSQRRPATRYNSNT